MDELDVLLDDFYGKYTDEKLTDEKRATIKKTYGDNTDQLLKDLYGKYADEDLSDDKISTINNTYKLKKKEDTDSTSEDQDLASGPKMDPGSSDTPQDEVGPYFPSQEINKEPKVGTLEKENLGIDRKTSVVLEDGADPSTVKMMNRIEPNENGKYEAFPSIFPKDPNKQTSDPKDWIVAKNEDEAYEIAKKRGEILEYDTVEEAKSVAEGSWKTSKKEESTDKEDRIDFYDESVNSINTDLIDREEKYVEKELKYLFGDYGFSFEQKGIGDALKVTAPNGKTLDLDLDPWTDKGEKEESDKLKTFLKENKPESNFSKLSQKKFSTQEEVDNSLKILNKEFNDFAKDVEQFTKDAEALRTEQEKYDPNNQYPEEYFNSNNLKAEELRIMQASLTKREQEFKSKSIQMEKLATKFVEHKSGQGDLGGGLWNSLMDGIGRTSSGLLNSMIDLTTYALPLEMQMGQLPYREEFVKKAKEKGIDVDMSKGNFDEWVKSVDKETISDINSSILDDNRKNMKYDQGMLDATRKGMRAVAGDKDTTLEWTDLKKQGFWGGAFLGVTESIPAMIGGGGPIGWSQRTAQMYAQVSDGLMEEMENNPEFENISESEKAAFVLPVGIVVGALEAVGFRNVMAQKGLLNKVLLRVLGKTGQNITGKSFKEVVEREVSSMLAKGALILTAGAAAEFETGASQEVVDILGKKVYNKIKEKEMFDTPETFSEGVKQVAIAGAQEAVGGFVISTPSAIITAATKYDFTKVDNKTWEIFQNLHDDVQANELFKTNIEAKVVSGELSGKEAKDQLDRYSQISGLMSKIPKDLSDAKKKKALGILLREQELKKEIAGKDERLVKKQNSEIEKLNIELDEILKAPEPTEAAPTPAPVQEPAQKEAAPTPAPVQEPVAEKPVEKKKEKVSDAINRPVTITELGGSKLEAPIEGDMYVEGQQVVVEDANGNITELGNVDEISDSTLEELGIAPQESNIKVTNKGNLQVGEDVLVPEKAGIKTDKRGNISRVVLRTEDGSKTVTLRGANAEDAAYQILLKEAESKEQASTINEKLEQDEEFQSEINKLGAVETTAQTKADQNIEPVAEQQTKPVENTKLKDKLNAEEKAIEEVEKKNTPSETSSLDNIPVKKGRPTVPQLLEMAEKAKKATSKILKDLKITVLAEDDFKKATGTNDKGWYHDGQIYINANKANFRTVAHEVFHAVLLKTLNSNSKAQAVTKNMVKSLAKTLVDNPKLLAALDKFTKRYGDDLHDEEAIAELTGYLAEHYESMSAKNKNIIKKWINDLIKALGLRSLSNEIGALTNSDNEVLSFLNTLAGKVAKGEAIEDQDISILKQGVKEGDGQFKPRKQAEKLFTEEAEKLKSLPLVAKFLDGWVKKNKVFNKSIENIPDEKVIEKFADHIYNEIKVWETVKGNEYVGFYNEDIPLKLNPELQKFAVAKYGRMLTEEEVSLYHIVSSFASPGADPYFDSSKGLEVFDRYMTTGELTGYSEDQATEWATNKKGKREDTFEPKFNSKGEPVLKQIAKSYAMSSIDGLNTLLDHFKGDLKKAVNWMESQHSYEEGSKMFGKPIKGAKSLSQHEYLSREDGGMGVFFMTGAKLGSYILNRNGNYSTVTKDMWYARTMARLSGEPLMGQTPKTKGKVLKTPWALTVEGVRKRKLADKAFAIVAEQLGTNPADVQQKIWDFEKRLYEKLGVVEKASYASDGLIKKSAEILKDFNRNRASIGIAPALSTQISKVSDAETALKNKEYGKRLITTINSVAEALGIKINRNNTSVGGWYSNDLGSIIKEASKSLNITYDTSEQLNAFASFIGTLAPEMQESVYVSEYSKTGKDVEHTFTFDTGENADIVIEKLNDFGLGDGYSYDTITKKLTIGDKGNNNLDKIKTLITFASNYGLKNHGSETANISFPSTGDYQSSLREFRDSFRSKSKKQRAGFDSLYEQAQKRLNDTPTPRQQRTWKSTAQEGLTALPDNPRTAEQWVKAINEKGGKGTSQETEWIGLEDFLNDYMKSNQVKSVPKNIVEDYIDDNQIEIEEVVKGGLDTSKEIERLKKLQYNARNANDYNIYQEKIDNIKETKYANYTLEGGENYREVLLTLPNKNKEFQNASERVIEIDDRINELYTDVRIQQYKLGSKELEDIRYKISILDEEKRRLKKLATKNFTSSHWDETNILAHVRMNDRALPNGERVLFIEELQSDWAQEGKRRGFDIKNKPLPEGYTTRKIEGGWIVIDPSGKRLPNARRNTKEEAILSFHNTNTPKGVPDMPYKKTDQWVGMAMRRVMQMASNEGFDRIAWATGEQSADRYDLSKQVNYIDYWKNANGTYGFATTVEITKPSELTTTELESYVGKEIAQKIINDTSNPTEFNPKRLEGQDLKVGGEGMKAFYNSILPKVAKKEAQRFDKNANVEAVEINVPTNVAFPVKVIKSNPEYSEAELSRLENLRDDFRISGEIDKANDVQIRIDKLTEKTEVDYFRTEEQAKDWISGQSNQKIYTVEGTEKGTKQLSIPITETAKQKLDQPLPRFQKQADESKKNPLFRRQVAGEKSILTEEEREGLFSAKVKHAAGVDKLAIRIATGWEMGGDGKWRYEFDDSKMKLDDEFFSMRGYDLEEAIQYDELFKYYPDLRKVRISVRGRLGNLKGVYFKPQNLILLNGDLSESQMRSTVLHEIQHLIQVKEGFATGGTSQMANRYLRTKINTISVIKNLPAPLLRAAHRLSTGLFYGLDVNASKQEFMAELNSAKSKLTQDQFDLYQSIAGEVEARNVQNRMDMSAEERRNTLLQSTEDAKFAREDQIFFIDGKPMPPNVADVAIEDIPEGRVAVSNILNTLVSDIPGPRMQNAEKSPVDGITLNAAKRIIKKMKGSVRTSKTTAEIIEKGIEAMRGTTWFKNLDEKAQTKAEAQLTKWVADPVGSLIDGIQETEQRRSEIRTTRLKNTVENLKKLYSDEKLLKKEVIKAVKEKLDAADIPYTTKSQFINLFNKINNTPIKKMDQLMDAFEVEIAVAQNRRTGNDLAKLLKNPNKYITKQNKKNKAKTIDNETRKSLVEIIKWSKRPSSEIEAEIALRGSNLTPTTINAWQNLFFAASIAKAREHYMDSKEFGKWDQGKKYNLEQSTKFNLRAIAEIEDLINHGKSVLKEQIRVEAERLMAISKEGAEDTSHKYSGMTASEIQKARFNKKTKLFDMLVGKTIKAFNELFTKPTVNSFEFLLGYIDQNSNHKEGNTYKRFYSGPEGLIQRDADFAKDKRKVTKELQKAISGIIGKSFNNIFSDYFHSKSINSIKNTGIYLTDEAGNQNDKSESMSINQALYVHLVSKMEAQREQLRNQGWDDAAMGQLEEFLGPKYLEISDYITNMMKDRYNKYNKVHLELLRTDLGFEEGYFPTKYDNIDLNANVDLGGNTFSLVGVMPGNIISKVKNNNRVDVTQNAFDVLAQYLDSMERFYHYGRFTKDLNSLLNSKAVKGNIQSFDRTAYTDLVKLSKAVTGDKSDFEVGSVERTLYGVNAAVASGYILYKGYTALKQFLSMPAYTEFAQMFTVGGYKIPLLHKTYFGVKMLAQMNPYHIIKNYRMLSKKSVHFKERMRRGNIGDEFIESLLNSKTNKSLFNRLMIYATKLGITPNKFIDALTISTGGAVYYNQQRKMYEKNGLSRPEAEEQAIRDFELGFKITQQSSDLGNLAGIQIKKGALTSMFVPFKNAQMGYFRRIMANKNNIFKRFERSKLKHQKNGSTDTQAGVKAFGEVIKTADSYNEISNILLYTHVLPMIWQYVASGLPGLLTSWDDDDEEEMKRAALLGPLDGLFIIGDLSKYAYNKIILEKRWALEQSIILNEIEKTANEIAKASKDAGEYNINVLEQIAIAFMKTKSIQMDTYKNIYKGFEDMILNEQLTQENIGNILVAPDEITKVKDKKELDPETQKKVDEAMEKLNSEETQEKIRKAKEKAGSKEVQEKIRKAKVKQ